MKINLFGATTPEISKREIKNRSLAREVAAEGIVLLKNDNALPINVGEVALYGPGSRKTVKGGSGSGDVHERHSVTIEEGLKNAGFAFPTALWMDRFVEKYEVDVARWRRDVEEKIKGFGPIQTMKMFDVIHENPMPYPACTPILHDELTNECDTAIYVLSRQAGEGMDRRVEKGDYLLSDLEEESLKILSHHYKKLILVLNCGGVIDLSILDKVRIDAVIFYGQGGMEGGNALADILTGKVNPSGKLTDTWARNYENYPSANTFGHRNGDLENEEYSEGIYVGYRWFDKNGIKPRFEFGFGLSYTEYETKVVSLENGKLTIDVTNVGKIAGKEVLQLYSSKPGQDCEKKSLIAFTKTGLIYPGVSERIELPFDLSRISTFDEEKSAFIIEKGDHTLLLNGNECGKIDIDNEIIVKKVSPITQDAHGKHNEDFSDKVNNVLSKLSDKEKILLVVGGGYSIRCYNNVMGAAGRTCTKLLKKGIPNIILADGPAGLNVNQINAIGYEGFPRYPEGLPEDWQWGYLKKLEPILKTKLGTKKTVYRYMTAWPSETVQAQTWNTELIERLGEAVGNEMLEIGVSIWLAPGLNIHRNPLCGRNFEYYSEDPLISGKMAAAITRGVQSVGGVGVAQKHFCCNNQEDNRTGVSANISQRALREIYLRAFEIAVKEGEPWTIMSSYNRVNGKHVCNTYDLCTKVLRKEWGFSGLVMSDWNATEQCSYAEAINAGNDLIMPGGNNVVKKLLGDLKEGKLDKNALNNSAARVLELIYKSDTCKDF